MNGRTDMIHAVVTQFNLLSPTIKPQLTNSHLTFDSVDRPLKFEASQWIIATTVRWQQRENKISELRRT